MNSRMVAFESEEDRCMYAFGVSLAIDADQFRKVGRQERQTTMIERLAVCVLFFFHGGGVGGQEQGGGEGSMYCSECAGQIYLHCDGVVAPFCSKEWADFYDEMTLWLAHALKSDAGKKKVGFTSEQRLGSLTDVPATLIPQLHRSKWVVRTQPLAHPWMPRTCDPHLKCW